MGRDRGTIVACRGMMSATSLLFAHCDRLGALFNRPYTMGTIQRSPFTRSLREPIVRHAIDT